MWAHPRCAVAFPTSTLLLETLELDWGGGVYLLRCVYASDGDDGCFSKHAPPPHFSHQGSLVTELSSAKRGHSNASDLLFPKAEVSKLSPPPSRSKGEGAGTKGSSW